MSQEDEPREDPARHRARQEAVERLERNQAARALVELRCPGCGAALVGEAGSGRCACGRCGWSGRPRRCPTCGYVSLGPVAPRPFTCAACQEHHRVFHEAAMAATLADRVHDSRARGADLAAGDTLVDGLTVIGAVGWAPPVGVPITMAVCADHLVFATTVQAAAVPYADLTVVDFDGGPNQWGGGFIGEHFGRAAVANGIIPIDLLESVTTRSPTNALVRLGTADGEVYLHRRDLPERVRMVMAPVVEAFLTPGAVDRRLGPGISP